MFIYKAPPIPVPSVIHTKLLHSVAFPIHFSANNAQFASFSTSTFISNSFSKTYFIFTLSNIRIDPPSCMYPLLGFTQLYAVLYQSLGMPKEALIVGTARQGIFFLPLIIILPKLIGVDGVLLTQAVADLFTVILTAFYAHKTNKDLKNMVSGKTSESTCLSN